MEDIQCLWTPYLFNAKEINLCEIEPYTFGRSNHIFGKLSRPQNMFLATGNFFHTSPLNRCINEFIFGYYKLLKVF